MLRFPLAQTRLIATCLMATGSLAYASDLAALTRDVQTILDRNCVKCHGPLEQNAGLRLDSVAAIEKGSSEGPVVVLGQPASSKLAQVLAADADPHMPPKKQLADDDVAKVRAWIASAATKPAAESPPVERIVPTDPTEAIDFFLADGWHTRQLTPAPVCDDRTFIRRVTLDLIGRIPKPEETLSFLFDASRDKRNKLVDHLLASDEAAQNFREVWDLLLMGRRGARRDERRREGGWHAFLENAYKQNRPWDDVVRTLITARPVRPEDAGAIWFLYERRNDHQQIAEAIAPVIYGTRIDCAQCHDHPLAGEIKQEHYWGLVAAFNRSKNTEKGPPAVQESASGGFMNFTNLKKESQPAAIVMLTGSKLDEPRPAKDEDTPDRYVDPNAAVRVPKFSRRASFAEIAAQGNPLLARSFVNHTWAVLMGRGIVDPPDEINSKHPASHPELLDWLTADFAAHNYSPRRLIRAIVLSRGYQLAPWTKENSPPPDAFAAACEKPLTAEAIARSMQIASGRPTDESFRQALAERFSDAPTRPARATIQQTMFLANSEQMADLFSAAAASETAVLPTTEDRVIALFRRALVRDPDAEELARGVSFLHAQSDPATATAQLLWAIASGPEFLTNH
jgi:mono/diheme cytochrome c family protein